MDLYSSSEGFLSFRSSLPTKLLFVRYSHIGTRLFEKIMQIIVHRSVCYWRKSPFTSLEGSIRPWAMECPFHKTPTWWSPLKNGSRFEQCIPDVAAHPISRKREAIGTKTPSNGTTDSKPLGLERVPAGILLPVEAQKLIADKPDLVAAEGKSVECGCSLVQLSSTFQ